MQSSRPARRILFVESSTGGVVGGSLTGILHLIDRMDRERFEPSLVLFEAKTGLEELQSRGVAVHVLATRGVRSANGTRGPLGRALLRARKLSTMLARARAFTRIIRRERADLVYVANGVPANLAAVLAAARCGVPQICHQKGFEPISPVDPFLSQWVDCCVGMTEELTDYYRSRGIRAHRFVTIYDGIDCTLFTPGGGAAIRREFGIPENAPVVGIVGHIQEWKGQHLVAEAVARVRRKHPDLYCLIVGGVHRLGIEYGARLRERIAAPDLAGHVILTGARHDVAACLDAMDVAIHYSVRSEPFGRVMIEAMALGCPVIAPREGGPLVIVVDGETGILVPPRDVDALAGAIDRMLCDPEGRRAMGQAGRRRVDAVFDIRHHVEAMETLFDEILGAAPPSRGGTTASRQPDAPVRAARR